MLEVFSFARMDWGLGNPNKTAVLIAMISILVASVCRAVLRGGGWWAAAFLPPLFTCLVLTGSRGGMVSLAFGLMLLLLRQRCGARGVWAAAGLACVVAIAMGAWQRVALTRQMQDVTRDASVINRLDVWRQVPEMIASAPGGWGVGRSGDAFMQWFQPMGRIETYRTLVNSHLTWLSEFGWAGRVAYLCAWSALLTGCWVLADTPLRAIPLAIWSCFFIGACFSSVAESWILWIFPVASFGFLLNRAPSAREIRSWGRKAFALGCAAVALTGILAWHDASAQTIHYANGETRVGMGQDVYWVAAPRKDVLGRRYGQEIRGFLAATDASGARLHESASFLVTEDLRTVRPLAGAILILAGEAANGLCTSQSPHGVERLILLNPDREPSFYAAALERHPGATIILGEFMSATLRREWEALACADASLKLRVEIVSGCEKFLTNWTRYLTPS